MSERLVVRAAIAPMHAEARVSSAQVSQRLAGHTVTVLASEGDWVRAHGEDAYEGWMHRGYLEPASRYLTSAERRLSLGAIVRDEPTGAGHQLPLGAWLREHDRLIHGEVADASTRATLFPRGAEAIATTAVDRFAGTPYQWGGVSPWGADCSGIVQTTFWLHGIQLPRDAWQQAEVGSDIGSTVGRWEPADLLFFNDRPDRRITHVGIALGDARMVHVALGRGGYAVERLRETDDPYVASLMTRLVAARRVL
jgi:gamma-D-glutamyl-L-lysine dipeptidyl-peptidase